MENQLTQAENTFKKVLKHVPIGFAEIDSNGTISFLNNKGQALLKPILIAHNFEENNFFPVLESPWRKRISERATAAVSERGSFCRGKTGTPF